ncbi:hypothetical protein ACWCRD_12070 [Streptomyces sp. NPDC002092]
MTVEVARMLGEGLLECPAAPVPIPGARTRRRHPPPHPASARTTPPQSPTPVELPRRRPGGFFRLRNGTPK